MYNKIFYDNYFPVTQKIGFIREDIQTVANRFEEWESNLLNKNRPVCKLKRYTPNETFPRSLNLLSPLTTLEIRKNLFVQAKNGWTAHFCNYIMSGQSIASQISKFLKCDSVIISHDPGNFGRLGGSAFQVCGDIGSHWDNNIRWLTLINEGTNWTWYEKGEVLPFEEPQFYKLKKKKDRLTLDILVKYSKHYGIDLLNEEYYNGQQVFFEIVGPLFESEIQTPIEFFHNGNTER